MSLTVVANESSIDMTTSLPIRTRVELPGHDSATPPTEQTEEAIGLLHPTVSDIHQDTEDAAHTDYPPIPPPDLASGFATTAMPPQTPRTQLEDGEEYDDDEGEAYMDYHDKRIILVLTLEGRADKLYSHFEGLNQYLENCCAGVVHLTSSHAAIDFLDNIRDDREVDYTILIIAGSIHGAILSHEAADRVKKFIDGGGNVVFGYLPHWDVSKDRVDSFCGAFGKLFPASYGDMCRVVRPVIFLPPLPVAPIDREEELEYIKWLLVKDMNSERFRNSYGPSVPLFMTPQDGLREVEADFLWALTVLKIPSQGEDDWETIDFNVRALAAMCGITCKLGRYC